MSARAAFDADGAFGEDPLDALVVGDGASELRSD
jgi:hypothetical protein